MTDTPTTRQALQRLAGMAMLAFAAFAGAHPCPGDGEPGTLDAFVRPGTDELKEAAFSRSARVTVTDVGGDVVGQGEGPLTDLHRFELPPGQYALRIDGPGLRTVSKTAVVVVANKTTESTTFVVAE